MRNLQKGFTLIELMIVVAIIGILASIAIPAYQDYIARAQVTEGVELLAAAKAPLSAYYPDYGKWPPDAAEIGVATQGRYVANAVEITTGADTTALTLVMRATFKSTDVSKFLQSRQIVFETDDGGKLWTCRSETGATGVADKHLPS